MARLRGLTAEAGAGLLPWEPVPEDRLVSVAAQCGPAEIAEIVAASDALSAERAGLPDWDGDSQDDIAAVGTQVLQEEREAGRQRLWIGHPLAGRKKDLGIGSDFDSGRTLGHELAFNHGLGFGRGRSIGL